MEKTFITLFAFLISIFIIWIFGWFITFDYAWIISTVVGRLVFGILFIILIVAQIREASDY